MTPEPWERQPRETSKAWDAFRFYRDTAPRERSLAKASAAYYEGAWSATKVKLWETWSVKHRWQARVEAWDAERDRVARQAELEEIARMREQHIRASRAVQTVALEALQRLQNDLRANPNKRLPPDLVLKLLVQGANLERITRGEPTEIERHEGPAKPITWSEFLAQQRAQRGLPEAPAPFGDTETD